MTKQWPFASKRHEALTQAARHAMQRAEDLRVSDPEDAAEWLQVASELDPDRAAAADHRARLAACDHPRGFGTICDVCGGDVAALMPARLAADDFHDSVCTGTGVPAGFTCTDPSHARLAAGTDARCTKCGTQLSACDTCGKPAMCGDAWCTECAPDEPVSLAAGTEEG